MYRFPVDWDMAPISTEHGGGGDVHASGLKLNDEWMLVCIFTGNKDHWCTPHSIVIQREYAFQEITIYGTLSFQNSDQSIISEGFSKLITSGSSSITLINLDPEMYRLHFLYKLNSMKPPYFLKGVINIAPISGRCVSDFENGDYTKNVYLKSLKELSNEFESLLDPQTNCFADVNLKCGSESIPCHKNILSARSPVFAAMFRNPMKESNENEVDISDLDVSSVRAMLTYMYTGKTSNLTVSLVSDLLFAADKYRLQDLKSVCCDFLKGNVCLQNVLRIFVLGDLHEEGLKLFAQEFICNKCTQFAVLEETEEWKTLRKERPSLAIDILTLVVKSWEEKVKRSS